MNSTLYDIPALVEKINSTSNNISKDGEDARRQCLDAARGLWRLLKHLNSMGTIYETGPNEYISTPISKSLKEPVHRDAYPTMVEQGGPAIFALPEFLAKTQYKNPEDPADSAFTLGHGTKDQFFVWLTSRPERLSQFQNHMTGKAQGRSSWMDPHFFPVEERLVKGAKTGEDAVFLVDIGGGKGHDLAELHQKHPNLPGKLVLQDHPDVIKEAEASGLDKKIVPMGYDFFTPQTLIGARAYFMHTVLHDWPDSKAHEILTNLKPGLTKGYSKLLIHEIVILDQKAHWMDTAMDLIMMSVFSSTERTEEDWHSLLEGAGYKIVRIWYAEPGTDALIEAELA
ncbi:MAG: hypothetical protein Q9191_006172 [Dirinaria sp. TL-2023a]